MHVNALAIPSYDHLHSNTLQLHNPDLSASIYMDECQKPNGSCSDNNEHYEGSSDDNNDLRRN